MSTGKTQKNFYFSFFSRGYWLVRRIMSLNELYPESKRRIHELELLLFEYERDNTHFSPTDLSLMMQNMYSFLHFLLSRSSYSYSHYLIVRSNQLVDLDNLCSKEPKTTR